MIQNKLEHARKTLDELKVEVDSYTTEPQVVYSPLHEKMALAKGELMSSPRSLERLRSQLALNNMSHEDKDTLLRHLLEQNNQYRQQVDEISNFGQAVATELILHQDQQRERLEMYKAEMEQKFHQLKYENPIAVHLTSELEKSQQLVQIERNRTKYAVLKLLGETRKQDKARNPKSTRN